VTEIEIMILQRAQHSLGYLTEVARANLVRLTAAYADNDVSWQVVVLDQADDDEIDEYGAIFTEVLADFQTATGDETLIKVKSPEEALKTEPLAIAIYP
jgi:hypothetical protein